MSASTPVEKPKSKAASRLGTFFVGLLGALAGGLLVYGLLYAATDGFNFEPVVNPPQTIVQQGNGSITITPLSDDPTLAEAVAAKTLPSVVNIDVYIQVPDIFGGASSGDDTDDRRLMEFSLGSGVVLTTDGYILTNYHVIADGDVFMVRFNQDIQLPGILVGSDPSSDLAVLKVDPGDIILVPIDIGDSDALAVGEWVMALGSPFGLDKTVSVGVVSALYRSTTLGGLNEMTIYANMIQTDAAINPGNSGGALVNRKGELIGINTLIVSAVESSAGIGFAIPINFAYNIAKQIMEGKPVEHAFLGVRMTTVDPSNADELGTIASSGAYVSQVVTGSPADIAGLQVGDVITRVGGVRVATATEVMIEIRGSFVGDTVSLEVVRNGQFLYFEVKLGSDINN
jgi:putative serine protease PepD